MKPVTPLQVDPAYRVLAEDPGGSHLSAAGASSPLLVGVSKIARFNAARSAVDSLIPQGPIWQTGDDGSLLREELRYSSRACRLGIGIDGAWRLGSCETGLLSDWASAARAEARSGFGVRSRDLHEGNAFHGTWQLKAGLCGTANRQIRRGALVVLEGEAASSAEQGREQQAGAVGRVGEQFHRYRRAGLSSSVSSACA